jgi:hypothetical protein
MAEAGIRFDAEQGGTTSCQNLIEHLEDAWVLVEMSSIESKAECDLVAPVSVWVARRPKVDVLDPASTESLSQSGLRETLLPREGQCPNINHTVDARIDEQLDELGDRSSLVADSEGDGCRASHD